MEGRSIKRIIILLLILQLLPLSVPQMILVKGEDQPSPTLRIVETSSGLSNITLGNETEPLPREGLQFTLSILMSGATSSLGAWQVDVTFDNNSLLCTAAWEPRDDPSYVFYGKTTVVAKDLGSQNLQPPEAVIGAALLNPADSVAVANGLLCMMNFTASRLGNFTISFLGVNGDGTFLTDAYGVSILVGTAGFSLTVVGAISNPVADFTFTPQNPQANQTVVFDASLSYDPSGERITAYLWDFGDNTTAANVTYAHAYSKNGLYLVNLTVLTAENLSGSTIKQLLVGSVPTAVFAYTVGAILPTELVTFNASQSTAINSTIVTYLWDFGDNSTFSGNDSIATHAYSSNGVYNVNLTVVDNYGVYNSTFLQIQIGELPVPFFSYDPQSPLVNETVTFTASMTSGSPIVAYEWDFGEGIDIDPAARIAMGLIMITNTSIVTHVFYGQENYTVSLTVFDIDGLHASSNQSIFVLSPDVPKLPDYTFYAGAVVIVVLFVVAIVISKVRRKKEEALEI